MSHGHPCLAGPARCAGAHPFDFLHVAQHNCLGSLLVFQLFFQDAVTSSRRPTCVLIQEPPLVRGSVPSFSGYISFHPPLSLGRPRVATYVDSAVARGLTVASRPAPSPLLVEVTLSSPLGICTTSQKALRIINVYNLPRAAASSAPRLTPSEIFPPGIVATLVAGDFNLHHYATDPTSVTTLRLGSYRG